MTPSSSEREVALQIVRALKSGGFVAYFAGGCVRDALLGVEPKDYDVATDARPPDIGRLFPDAQPVGEAFGVMLVHARGHAVQVASFRSDGPYSDQRRPDHVTFAGEREDAARRDFTINGLFLDPDENRVIDHVGGRSDLAAGVIRAIGRADQRLDEDHLRMLRAVRFAARYGFDIEPVTAEAIRRHAPRLAGISPERIGQEIRWMLRHPARAHAIELVRELGLEVPVLGPPPLIGPCQWLGGLEAARGSERRSVGIPLALAAWFLDRGEPCDAPEAFARWGRALVLSNEEVEGLRMLPSLARQLPDQWASLPSSRRRRLAGGAWFADLLHLLHARGDASREAAEVMVSDLAPFAETGFLPPPLIRGDDLLSMGLRPGPQIGRVLERLYDEQLDGRLTERGAAADRARQMIEELS